MPFDAVVVWKVDRLARRVIDFLHADETLQARGAAIVCVEQSIDMTTGEGRAFAQMLAVFGEMEAAANSSRSMAARAHLISQGRIPGGLQPYGWRSVANPEGPGYVRGQDPERIEWVRQMVARVQRGDTVYSVQTWLNTAQAPAPRGREAGRPWGYSSVDVLMRNPVLAGMFPIKSRDAYGPDGPSVRRGEDGRPVVAADGIITVEQYQALLHAITHKAHHSARSRKSRRATSPLLALLVTCRTCERTMHRCRNAGRPSLTCAQCGQMVTMLPLADHVIRRLLNERGKPRMYRRTLDVPDDPGVSQTLAGLDHALRAAALALTEDRTEADTRNLGEEVARLKRARLEARQKAGAGAVERMVYVGTVQQVWDLCVDDDQRRDVLAGQVDTLVVSKSIADGRFHSDRVELTWTTNRKPIVPEAISVGPIHRRLREVHPWISLREAARLAGSSESLIKGGIKRGQITQRKIHRAHPSLERASVVAFLRDRSSAD